MRQALKEPGFPHGHRLLRAGTPPPVGVRSGGRHDDVGHLSGTDETHLLPRSLLDEVGVPEPVDASLQPAIGSLYLSQLLGHTRDALALLYQLARWLDRHCAEQPEHQQDGDYLGADSHSREADPSHRKGSHALAHFGKVLAPG
jgi:hypothetical protein